VGGVNQGGQENTQMLGKEKTVHEADTSKMRRGRCTEKRKVVERTGYERATPQGGRRGTEHLGSKESRSHIWGGKKKRVKEVTREWRGHDIVRELCGDGEKVREAVRGVASKGGDQKRKKGRCQRCRELRKKKVPRRC